MSKDTCIKANTYCPVHKGIVGADCWHDSKDFSVPRTDWKQIDEITALREQVEKLTEESVVLRASSRSKLETISSLELQVEKLTKERDEYKSGFEAAASKYRNLKLQMQEIINVC